MNQNPISARCTFVHSVFFGLVIFLVASCADAQNRSAQAVFERLVEAWRFEKYWMGSTPLDGVYKEGTTANALVFWAKGERNLHLGLCSPELGFCTVAVNPDLDPDLTIMRISPTGNAEEAFVIFVRSNFNGSVYYGLPPSSPTTDSPDSAPPGISLYPSPEVLQTGRVRVEDYNTEEISVTLPKLTLPSALVRRDSSPARIREAEEAKSWFGCGESTDEFPRPRCEVVFPFRQDADPVWYVLIRCLENCHPEAPRETIVTLEKGDEEHTWMARGTADAINAQYTARLARLIENAAMVRLPLP